MRRIRSITLKTTLASAALLSFPAIAGAASNPICPDNTAFFNPTLPPSINLPQGFTASVFAAGLNFPTGIAFRGTGGQFEVFVLESGHGLPSPCNDQSSPIVGGDFSQGNPFTSDIVVFNQNGRKIRAP